MTTMLPDTPANQRLVEQVHPAGWVNPQPKGCYNLVVIGGGTAGLICAAGAAGLGAKVALIEQHLLGGDCLNYGCVPSKALIRASRAAFDAANGAEFGIQASSTAKIDFSAVMERMRRLRAAISQHDSARRFQDELGVDLYIGKGSFVSPDTVEVAGASLHFSKAVICSGARAAVPPIPGLTETEHLTNETVFSLTELPPRLAVIGAGPIGCELAQAFCRFGSSVTLLDQSPQLLPREDRDAADILHQTFIREGIDLRLGVKIHKVEQRAHEKIIVLEQDGHHQEVAADTILVGAGRIPNTAGLGLEAAKVRYDRSGVLVNDRLQTSNPRIYAAGDICSAYKFTHMADAMARMVLANALFKGRQKVSGLTIPWCTYTDPEIAHVGLYEHEAAAKGIAISTLTVGLPEVDRAVLDGESSGFARVHLKKGTDRILGATIVARHAGEMISEMTLAMTSGQGLGAIASTIHPYPTQAEVLKKLADAYNRTRLTPFVKKLLSGWLRWQRS